MNKWTIILLVIAFFLIAAKIGYWLVTRQKLDVTNNIISSETQATRNERRERWLI